MPTIRRCIDADHEQIFRVVNDAAQAYRGVIPDDCWHAPYMSRDELSREIADGVESWALADGERIVGVMGMQDRGEVNLIRHAYVRTDRRRKGVGTKLLRYLEDRSDKPILVGTWAAATWAVDFYRRNGYRLLSEAEKTALLRRFWTISPRQVETSVVLANRRWPAAST